MIGQWSASYTVEELRDWFGFDRSSLIALAYAGLLRTTAVPIVCRSTYQMFGLHSTADADDLKRQAACYMRLATLGLDPGETIDISLDLELHMQVTTTLYKIEVDWPFQPSTEVR